MIVYWQRNVGVYGIGGSVVTFTILNGGWFGLRRSIGRFTQNVGHLLTR